MWIAWGITETFVGDSLTALRTDFWWNRRWNPAFSTWNTLSELVVIWICLTDCISAAIMLLAIPVAISTLTHNRTVTWRLWKSVWNTWSIFELASTVGFSDTVSTLHHISIVTNAHTSDKIGSRAIWKYRYSIGPPIRMGIPRYSLSGSSQVGTSRQILAQPDQWECLPHFCPHANFSDQSQ